MHEKALDRPVGGGLHAVLALSQPTGDFVVPLPGHSRPLMNQHDCHGHPPRSRTSRVYPAMAGATRMLVRYERLIASAIRRTTSTFSCDVAYCDSPTASRALSHP